MAELRRLYHLILAGCFVLMYLTFFPEVLAGIFNSEPDPPQVVAHTQAWGELQFNRSVSQTSITIQGRRYWKGLGTHANSTIRVRIPEWAKTFIGACGIDDQGRERGEFRCLVRKNGKVAWETPVVSQRTPLYSFRLPVSALDAVELVVLAGDKGIDFAHANWVELTFEER